ncbi:MAG: hypothetical protein WBA97_34590 [Actinophytocola sp.]|uniref:phage distal tail protein n=1 Tax=Actinophytocola sp. TaxID=1872138 RepID=UPI003C7896C5
MSTQIVTPAWTVDGWSGNYVDDNGVTWFVSDDKGWFEPVQDRLFDMDKPASDGTYSAPNLDASRVITLTGWARAPDPVAADVARNKFNSLCKRGHLFPLVVEEPVAIRTAMVKRAGGNLRNTGVSQFEFQLILLAPDPRKYSSTVHSASTGLAIDAPGGIKWGGPAGSTGVEWGGPAGSTGVVWQTGAAENGVIQITNDGSEDTPIVFTIAGPVTSPIITRTDTGESLRWNGTVATGSQLVINTGTGSVLLDNGNQRPLLTRADFFLAPPGTIDVLFSAPSPSPTALLTATWPDAWI